MRPFTNSNIFAIAAVCIGLILIIFSTFWGQIPTPSPTAAILVAESPTPTPTGTPTPSPTPTPPLYPIPGWQNFHQWGSITLFNGLPSNSVRAIVQTPDGLMWFGTDGGLARFDGRRIQTLALGGSGTARILSLEISADGILWIGTSEGAFLYRNDQAEFITELGDQPIGAISAKGLVLIATARGEIFKLSSAGGEVIKFENIYRDSDSDRVSDAAITGLEETPAGILVGTSGNGLFRLEDGELVEISSSPRFINTFASKEAGQIWIATNAERSSGGFFSASGSGSFRPLGDNMGDLLALELDQSGGVWAGTAKRGLYRFKGSDEIEHFSFESTAGGLRSDTVYAVFVDREGVIWTGTNRGVCRFDPSSPFIRTISDNANSNFVRTLFQDKKGRIIAGTNYGMFNFDGEKWMGSETFPPRAIYAVSENLIGEMIIGGPGGIYDLTGRRLADGDARAFANFRGKTYAAIFERGLQNVSDPRSPPVFSASTPTTLFAAADRIWIGTAEGVVYSYDGTVTTRDGRFAELAGSAIRKIIEGTDGSIWIAGERGLFRMADDKLQSIVLGYDVRDLIVDGRDIWAATENGGLLHVVPDGLYGWVVSDLNVEQGLPSQKVFALLKRETELLIGTNRGIVNYQPSLIAPKVLISRVLSRRLHDPAEWSGIIALDFPQNSLLVEAAGLSSRTFPEQFQYSFLLKDSLGKMIEKRLSKEAQFSPANLKPGEYSIEARAYSKDLLVSEPAVVRFSIARAPFPWTATALGVLLFIAIVALIWAIVERRRIVLRNRELALARSDLANEAERERGRIARDLHDQTLADLRSLMMKSDRLLPDNPEFRGEIESVSTEIRRICEDLSPSVLENVGLVAALEFLLTRSVANHRFSTNENADELVNFPLSVQLHIYRIAQEILSNIKHHSDANLVEMSVEAFADQRLILTITDNGALFAPDLSINRGRGISNIRSRANIINAQIAWDEGPDRTNLFSLIITG